MKISANDTPSPDQLVAGLTDLLRIDSAGEDRYIGTPQPNGVGRMFGGQVIAQALQAAQASVADDIVVHSLHAYFLRGGREGPPTDLVVTRDFDGRSFANRRVIASQPEGDEAAEGNTPLLTLTASFQRPETGIAHCDSPMPDVAMPEDLPSDMDHRRKFIAAMPDIGKTQRALMLRPRPIEMRTTDKLHWMNAERNPPYAHSWFRTVAPVTGAADTPAMHRAILAYASDFTLLGTSALPHGLSWARGEISGASLDHAIWFHEPDIRTDEWLLYATDSPWSGGGRGFNRGRIFTRDGKLVASVAQEGVMRRKRKS